MRLLAALIATVAAVGAGYAVAVVAPWNPADVFTGSGGQPASAGLEDEANSREELPSVDDDVEFPAALSELPDLPEHLAIDPKTGDVWFVMFSYGGDNTLYRYDSTDGRVETRPIPASTGSSLFSDIAVDLNGRIISAEGTKVLVIEADGGLTEFPLGEALNPTAQAATEGTYVIDMEIAPGGQLYLTRMNNLGITELDLETGFSREIPIPTDLGQIYYLGMDGNLLWMTAPYHTATLPSGVAVLDLTTGETTRTSVKGTDLAVVKDGVLVAGAETPGLARIDRPGDTPWPITTDAQDSNVPAEILSEPGVVAIDQARGSAWIASAGRRGLASVDLVSGSVDYYELPSWPGTWLSVPAMCQYTECEPPGGGWTRVGDLAVAPNGDVYFSDQSFNRIGIVHPR